MINDENTRGGDEVMTAKKATKTAEVVEDTEEATETLVSIKDIAAQCDTDPKSFRRWLRRQTDDRAGKGGRWGFSTEAAALLVEAYKTKTATPAEDEADADA